MCGAAKTGDKIIFLSLLGARTATLSKVKSLPLLETNGCLAEFGQEPRRGVWQGRDEAGD